MTEIETLEAKLIQHLQRRIFLVDSDAEAAQGTGARAGNQSSADYSHPDPRRFLLRPDKGATRARLLQQCRKLPSK